MFHCTDRSQELLLPGLVKVCHVCACHANTIKWKKNDISNVKKEGKSEIKGTRKK